MERRTNYYLAAHWLNNSLVLCNDIVKIDPDLEYRFDYYDEETDSYTEIYQFFITSASLSDVEYLEKSFGLLFAYSPLLDCFILCVDHFGTMWSGVGCTCYNDDIPDSYLEKSERRIVWE